MWYKYMSKKLFKRIKYFILREKKSNILCPVANQKKKSHFPL